MSFTIESWQDTDILIVRGAGNLGAKDVRGLATLVEEACAAKPSSRVVLDLSCVSYVPTADEARQFAERFVELARRKCLMAIAARPGAQFGVARMVESLASVRDMTVGAFESVENAVAWMHSEHT